MSNVKICGKVNEVWITVVKDFDLPVLADVFKEGRDDRAIIFD